MFPLLSAIDVGAAIGYTVRIETYRKGQARRCITRKGVQNETGCKDWNAGRCGPADGGTASGAPRKLACFGDTGTGQLAVLGDGIGMTIIFK